MFEITVKTLKHGDRQRKRLMIQFTDPNLEIIAEFLMTDAELLERKILRELEDVLSARQTTAQFSGNRTNIKMNKQITEITDLFFGLDDNMETYQAVEIDTEKFKNIIDEWFSAVDKFNERNQ